MSAGMFSITGYLIPKLKSVGTPWGGLKYWQEFCVYLAYPFQNESFWENVDSFF